MRKKGKKKKITTKKMIMAIAAIAGAAMIVAVCILAPSEMKKQLRGQQKNASQLTTNRKYKDTVFCKLFM